MTYIVNQNCIKCKLMDCVEVCPVDCFYEGKNMLVIKPDECIKCKLTDCVEVCPVDCFYEGENMLVINPDECIDCGVCEPECPIDAIKSDNDDDIKDKEKWLLLNKKFSAIWPNISKKKEPMDEHEKFREIKDKFDQHFSEKCSLYLFFIFLNFS